MKTTKRVFIIFNILNFIDKQIIIPTLRQPCDNIVIQMFRSYNIAKLLIFLINVNNVCSWTIQIEPILKQFEYLALSYAALTDQNQHHASINQTGYLFNILWARNKFHYFEFFCKDSKL